MTEFSQLKANLEMARKKLDLACANCEAFMAHSWARERVWRLMADAHEALIKADANMSHLAELQSRVPENR